VNVYYLLASDTIEEKIAMLLDQKRKVMDAVLDGKITETDSLLSALMNDYAKPKIKK
jgi:SNF2 family DNA or RNA helicase